MAASEKAGAKLPQMQWNTLHLARPSALLDGIDDPWFYFVHSFSAPASKDVVATCAYGTEVTAIVERGNVWGTQFHPEKSSNAGLRLLGNFARIVNERKQS